MGLRYRWLAIVMFDGSSLIAVVLNQSDWLSALPWDRYAPLIVILCLGIFVQSAAGFAAGLLIVPLLLWSGYGLPEAMSAMLVATIPQNAWGIWAFRGHVDWRFLTLPALTRILFIPIGILVLHRIELISPSRLRQIVGGVVVMATVAMVVFRVTPRNRLPAVWSVLVFPLSGFMQGLVGMGGPPMVLWVQAHDWPTERTRGFLFATYSISLAPALLLLYITFGASIVPGCIMAILSMPFLWPATKAGLAVGSWLGRQRLRRVTIALLILIGMSGLLAPVFS